MKLPVHALTLIFLISCSSLKSSPDKQPLKAFKSLSNVMSDGEHAYGYSIWLWKGEASYYAIILEQAGLIGDGPNNFTDKVEYNEKTQDFLIQSDMPFGCGAGKTSEQITIKGTLNKSKLIGKVSYIPKKPNPEYNDFKITLQDSTLFSIYFKDYNSISDLKEGWSDFLNHNDKECEKQVS